MLSPIIIADSPAQHTAVIRLMVPAEEIQLVMGPAIHEVFAALASQAIAPVDALFCRHFRNPSETFDFEVGVPTARALKTQGRVLPSTMPAVRVVQTVYVGGYHGLGRAWGLFDEAIDIGGYTVGPMLWERYIQGPESGTDETMFRTELNRPLA
jgi:effector-binding domain-containing protein